MSERCDACGGNRFVPLDGGGLRHYEIMPGWQKCAFCDGRQEVDYERCSHCGGRGETRCTKCHGTGYLD